MRTIYTKKCIRCSKEETLELGPTEIMSDLVRRFKEKGWGKERCFDLCPECSEKQSKQST